MFFKNIQTNERKIIISDKCEPSNLRKIIDFFFFLNYVKCAPQTMRGSPLVEKENDAICKERHNILEKYNRKLYIFLKDSVGQVFSYCILVSV